MPYDPDRDAPGTPRPQFRPEDLDLSKLPNLTKWIVLAVVLFVLWYLVSWVISFYRDWLWFSNLDHQAVLLKVMSTRIVLSCVAFALFLALAAPNLRIVLRGVPQTLPAGGPQMPPDTYRIAVRLLAWLGWAAAAAGAVFLASRLASEWEVFLLWLNAVSFNETEPIFGKDFSFYIFTLPLLQFLRSWLLPVPPHHSRALRHRDTLSDA